MKATPHHRFVSLKTFCALISIITNIISSSFIVFFCFRFLPLVFFFSFLTHSFIHSFKRNLYIIYTHNFRISVIESKNLWWKINRILNVLLKGNFLIIHTYSHPNKNIQTCLFHQSQNTRKKKYVICRV